MASCATEIIMARPWRHRAIAWLLLGLFAAPAFLGQGLHGLSGSQHSLWGTAESGCCGCEHSDHADVAGDAGCPAETAGLRAAAADRACGACPICDYFAQNSLTALAAAVAGCQALVSDLVIEAVFAPRCSAFWAFSARAPPVG